MTDDESDHARRLRKMAEKLEMFRLACKRVEVAAEDLEKFCRQESESAGQGK